MKKDVVLVTGASGGIGAAIAKKFAKEGHPVALHYYASEIHVNRLAEELQREGCKILCVQADLRKKEAVHAMFETVRVMLGEVGILINNAGIAQQKMFTDLTEEDWRNMFAIHVDGAFYCIQEVLPIMIRVKKGCIVNISSMWGQVGGACEVHYSAAKGALEAMTKALAKEVGPSHIRVNCVAPGLIQTDMNKNLEKETLTEIQEDTPLQMIGEPKHVANVVYFLASDQAEYITGQVVGCNGGLVI